MNKKSIHIVHIIPTLTFGGAERCVVDIINHADPDQFRFSVIVFFPRTALAAEIKRKNVEILLVPKRGKLGWSLVRQLTDALSRLRPDVAHTHLFGADVWGRIAAKRLGIPILSTEHNNYSEGWPKNMIKRWLADHSDYYTATSEAIRAYAIQRYRIAPSRIETVRCGIDLKRFAHLPPPPLADPLQLLILGRLAEQKGHRVALQALARLQKYPWKLKIAGSGELEGKLRALVAKFNLTERVVFQPATLDVPELLAYTDMLLVPSLWEGLGIAAMEAMAAGRTVIASRTGGLPELIAHDKTGYLVPPAEPQALAEQIAYCFTHRTECLRIGQEARKYAKEHFGVEGMVKRYEEIYCVIARKPIRIG